MITYSHDNAILSLLVGKLCGCEDSSLESVPRYKCSHYISACSASACLVMKAG